LLGSDLLVCPNTNGTSTSIIDWFSTTMFLFIWVAPSFLEWGPVKELSE
jgi:hypothetical protein